MEFYEPSFTTQLAPLVKIALGQGPEAKYLRSHLDRAQLSHPVWDNVIIKNRLLATKFHIRYAASESEIETSILSHKSRVTGAHSPLSPFNTLSDLFPSGVISSKWFSKYVDDVPFAVVCSFSLANAENDAQLAETLTATRAKYLNHNVRFVAIVVSSATDSVGIQDRIAHLRQASGLANLLGLFHLLLLVESMETECEMLASSLLNALKTSATDFYSGIELRVKQRFKKYYTMPRSEVKSSIELLPKILETRNIVKQAVLLQFMHPHNIESSIPLLEQSYAGLFELLAKNVAHFFSKSRTPHDRKVYIQWRTLLDIVAIHLVRGYFSIERSVLAMNRHRSHVRAVTDLLSAHSQHDISIWAATQYHWFAELVELVPYTISQEFHEAKKPKDQIEFLGGLILSDGSVLVTSPNLLYKRAASELSTLGDSFLNSEPLSDRFTSISDILAYKIKLYGLAQESTMTSNSAFLASLDMLLLVDIADTYVALGDYKKSSHFYEEAQSKCTLPAWAAVYQSLSNKLLSAAINSGDLSTALKQLANLSIFATPIEPLPDFDLSSCSVVDLNSLSLFVNAEVSLFNQSLNHEVRVYDTVVTQIKLESAFNAEIIERAIPGSKVDIMLNNVVVKYDNKTVFSITDTGNQNEQIQSATLECNKAAFNLSNFGEHTLVLQMKHEASNTGWLLVTEMCFALTIGIKLESGEYQFGKNELVIVDQQKIGQTFDVYAPNQHGLSIRTQKELKGRVACKVFVKPYKPNLMIETESEFDSIIIGEKLETAVKLVFPESSLANVGCKSVKLLVETIVYEDMIETKELHAQANWDQMKDDEPMDLLEALQLKTKQRKHNLRVCISKSPSSMVPKDMKLKAVLYFKLIVTSALAEVSEYHIKQLEISVLACPFSPKLTITPCSYDDKTSSIPNPFVVKHSSEGLSMPLLSRAWLLNSLLQDIHGLLLSGDVSITETKFHLRSTNPEVSFSWLSELSSEDLTHVRQFVTSGRYRPTTTNVNMVASISFSYKRNGSNMENNFETKDEVFDMPLQDPRVLVHVDHIDALVHLCFTIENPTSRIVTLSTALITDIALNKGISWEFEDVRNELPLKQTITPILPFCQHKLEYFGTYVTEANNSNVELPQLQVYDMHYKLNLPTVALQANVKVIGSRIYIKH
ncbi:hypothetical protein METBIDRAFT_42364 [Metschnikowia bicuspidata var. bicuspidata NRRL YB-4993]|uniref:Trafficking protein particle complex subunit 11 domain-containing protein n=1 Tax=Metschnikowia bicuspidata var. bicuspidata NRRL YB-4993 TaxID=869754 RepID=A0A1A0HC41_9ASCO|nr:hypothetical protein METBIDRAFT_42364 [Metschnikowia bicuspidata var. bicuspidata NRRL YB-4993]OBA21704.1 hypothetical protein METBIDRAFT_42364 [Metschnikowia bicuspidata var. bicuspidata NRRL YB-4993]